MATSIAIRFKGGDLTKLYKFNHINRVNTLYIKSGYLDMSKYSYFEKMNPKTQIVFPQVNNLILDNPDSKYIFDHCVRPYFPNLKNLLLHNVMYDHEGLYRFFNSHKILKNVYYTKFCNISDETWKKKSKELMYIKPRISPQEVYTYDIKKYNICLNEITKNEFDEFSKKLMGDDIFKIHDKASCFY